MALIQPTTTGTPIELLAPAGDADAMRAAVANGADAVYFGLSDFNARHRAANFTLAELPATIAYLHAHNVRAYITFNTLIFSDELEQAVEFITAIANAGADAVIVQDLGVARLIHRLCPGLPIHGSTQMTLTERRGIDMVRQLGIERVILARELSADEIGVIAGAVSIPVEVFIHGALCVAYSGQCLTSESLGGRSANRGQCAQACRLPYDLIVDDHHRDLGDKAYLLSPQDLAAYDLVGDLITRGVRAFKIEGRLKSAHYVAATTQTYRAAIDAALGQAPFVLSRDRQQELAQSFSRGFTHGFLDGVNHQELVHARFPKSRGLRIGHVTGKTRDGIIVQLDNAAAASLKPGDGVVFDEGHPEQDEQGGRIFLVKPVRDRREGPRDARECVEITLGRGDVNLAAVAVGSIVWKTDDPAVRRKLEQSFNRETVVRRAKLSAEVDACVGGPLSITVRDDAGHEARVQWPGPLALAQKHPITMDVFREQFGRMGDTPFELGDVAVAGGAFAAVMIPKSVLNDLRRQATAQLLAMREQSLHPAIAEPDALANLRREIAARVREDVASAPPPPSLYVLARSMEQLQAVLDWRGPEPLARPAMVYCEFEDVRRYKDAVALARGANMPIALATLRIVKPAEEGLINQLAMCEPDAVLVRNLASIGFLREKYPAMPLIGDYALNVANELTADLMGSFGLVRITPSYDLTWKQLSEMLGNFPAGCFEAVIHQHMPMFHIEHCVFAHTLSDGRDFRTCGRPCEKHRVELRDRARVDHPLLADVGCRNTVYNGVAQSAAEFVPEMKRLNIRHFRVELLREAPAQASALLDRYARVLLDLEDPRTAWRRLRVLNQLGVTRGTLEE